MDEGIPQVMDFVVKTDFPFLIRHFRVTGAEHMSGKFTLPFQNSEYKSNSRSYFSFLFSTKKKMTYKILFIRILMRSLKMGE
jgi:hypothetical protein